MSNSDGEDDGLEDKMKWFIILTNEEETDLIKPTKEKSTKSTTANNQSSDEEKNNSTLPTLGSDSSDTASDSEKTH